MAIEFDRRVHWDFVVARYNIDGDWKDGKVEYAGGNTYILKFDFGAVKWAKIQVGVISPVTGDYAAQEFFVTAWKVTPDPFGRKRK
ncbi:MAG: hypothetical protein WC831_01205 [Parcubacteria group bacterium]|jgi:hypothetical protein